MKIIYLIAVMGIIASACSKTSKMNYPETRKENVVDSYFGTEVEDPYRWLEDDNSAETAAWVEAQNEVTFGYLNQLPERERINSRLTELMDFPRVSAPSKRAGKYFYYKNDGLQNQSVLYMSDSLNGPEEILLDPNKLSDDGTIALEIGRASCRERV